jgi:hypothetical protein
MLEEGKSSVDLHMKVVLGAIVYLIIASVFVLNYQISHEAVAKSGSDDNTVISAKKVLTAPAHGDSDDNSQHQTVDLSGTRSLTSSDPAKPGPGPVDNAPAPPLAMSEHGSGANGSPDGQATFRHNAEDIAMELSGLTSEEIKQYPITDLSNSDIILVLGFLDPGNLTRILLYIPQEDLIKLQQRLTPLTFDESLSRLSGLDRRQVEDRLVSASSSVN